MFFDLGTCRFSGTAPIPWIAAKEYAEYHHINFKYLWQIISALDSAYLSHLQREQEERMNRLENKSHRSAKHG